MTRTGDREIGVVSGRLPDNTGELACMQCWRKSGCFHLPALLNLWLLQVQLNLSTMATFGPVAIGSGRCEEVAIVESFFCLPGQKKIGRCREVAIRQGLTVISISLRNKRYT